MSQVIHRCSCFFTPCSLRSFLDQFSIPVEFYSNHLVELLHYEKYLLDMMLFFASNSNFFKPGCMGGKIPSVEKFAFCQHNYQCKKINIGKCTKLLVQDGLIADPVSFARSKAG